MISVELSLSYFLFSFPRSPFLIANIILLQCFGELEAGDAPCGGAASRGVVLRWSCPACRRNIPECLSRQKLATRDTACLHCTQGDHSNPHSLREHRLRHPLRRRGPSLRVAWLRWQLTTRAHRILFCGNCTLRLKALRGLMPLTGSTPALVTASGME